MNKVNQKVPFTTQAIFELKLLTHYMNEESGMSCYSTAKNIVNGNKFLNIKVS